MKKKILIILIIYFGIPIRGISALENRKERNINAPYSSNKFCKTHRKSLRVITFMGSKEPVENYLYN